MRRSSKDPSGFQTQKRTQKNTFDFASSFVSKVKPVFETTENSIRIILPVLKMSNHLTEDEDKIFRILKGRLLSSSTISEGTGFGKSKTVAILNKLVKQ